MGIERHGARKRVLLAENDPWRREGIAALLSSEGFVLAADAPDIALVNISRRSAEATEMIEGLKQKWPELRVIAIVMEIAAHTVFPALVGGVNGVLAFDAEKKEIVTALHAVLGGSIWVPRGLLERWVEQVVERGLPGVAIHTRAGEGLFTPSQWRILEALAEELSNKEIARRVHVTEATVKFHVGQLLRMTGARDRRGLARMYREIETSGRGVPEGWHPVPHHPHA
jgi:DNA-binding NarL/FixJ family response regulator